MATFPASEPLYPFICHDCGVKFVHFTRHIKRCEKAKLRSTIEDINLRKEYIYWLFGKKEHPSIEARNKFEKHKEYICQLYDLIEMARRRIPTSAAYTSKLSKSERNIVFGLFNSIDKNYEPPMIAFKRDHCCTDC
jgi:hypothetical protein